MSTYFLMTWGLKPSLPPSSSAAFTASCRKALLLSVTWIPSSSACYEGRMKSSSFISLCSRTKVWAKKYGFHCFSFFGVAPVGRKEANCRSVAIGYAFSFDSSTCSKLMILVHDSGMAGRPLLALPPLDRLRTLCWSSTGGSSSYSSNASSSNDDFFMDAILSGILINHNESQLRVLAFHSMHTGNSH